MGNNILVAFVYINSLPKIKDEEKTELGMCKML